MITIRRPVSVKMIVTEQSKAKIDADYRSSIRRIKLEMEQLQFQGKKLIAEAQKKGNDAVKIVQDRIGQEFRTRREKLEWLHLQLEQLNGLPIGSEIAHGTVDSECTVQVGDNWEQLMQKTEIVIKDSIVVEIRQSEAD